MGQRNNLILSQRKGLAFLSVFLPVIISLCFLLSCSEKKSTSGPEVNPNLEITGTWSGVEQTGNNQSVNFTMTVNDTLLAFYFPDHKSKAKILTFSNEARELIVFWHEHPDSSMSGSYMKISWSGNTGEAIVIKFYQPQASQAEAANTTAEFGELLNVTRDNSHICANPSFTLSEGTYQSAQAVSMFCITAEAEIRYTLDGSDPTDSSEVYAGAVSITATTILKARAFKTGYTASDIVTANYVIIYPSVDTPLFNLQAGTYTSQQRVTISCSTVGAVIRYTTNGQEPDVSSTVYNEPVLITQTTTLKAKAFKTGLTPSALQSAVYRIWSSVESGFVFVQGGSFGVTVYQPYYQTYQVTLSAYYLQKYEITQTEYFSTMGINPSHFSGVLNLPVEQVTWFNAITYCNKRSIAEGLTPCYSYSTYGTNPSLWPFGWNFFDGNHVNIICDWSANGYRLPTEAEWQYAAQGRSYSTPYIENLDETAWYIINSDNSTHAVGGKLANGLVIYDMSGNVWEWCWDQVSIAYGYLQGNNPHGAETGLYRIKRGGSWSNNFGSCLADARDMSLPTTFSSAVGFRICRNNN